VKSAKSVVSFSSPGAFLALVWLALGFAPVLVTGPGLATTQAIGMLPVLYVFPALALVAGYRVLVTRHSSLVTLLLVVLYTAIAIGAARVYFGQWTNHPEVRVQYETTMVTTLRYLDAHGRGAAAVSTITPGQYHTPAVAALTLHNPAVRPRWFDGRESLLLPDAPDTTLVIPGFTPIPAALQPYLAAATLTNELPMRPDDLDRPIRLYAVDGPAAIAAALARMRTADGRPPTAAFDDRLELLGYELSTPTARPGETVTLVTAWRLRQPLPGAALFAHVIAPDALIAQADGLGAPGEGWAAGDVLLQLHTLTLPADAVPGNYPLAVGVYTRPDGARLRLPDGADMLTLTTLTLLAPESDG